MKIWMRLLAGSVIGVLLGMYLPEAGGDTREFFRIASEITLSVGRYAIFPLVLFSLAAGTYELRSERKLVRVYLKTIGLVVVTGAVLIVLGTGAVLVFSPARIPPIFQEAPAFDLPTLLETVFQVFPRNMFAMFADAGVHLLPLYVLAVILGLLFAGEQFGTEPVAAFFDSAGRLMYRLNSLVTEVIGIGFIAFGARLIFNMRQVAEFEIFAPLILVLVILILALVLVLYPVLIYFFGGRRNPYIWLYAMLAPGLAGFFSADAFLSLGVLTRAGRENIGVPRMIGTTVFPLFAIVGKAGTGLVAAAAFIVVLQSYTALEITVAEAIWVMTTTFGISLLLGPVPGSGVLVALGMLSNAHAGGMEEAFVMVQPIIPLLIALGVFLDVMTAGFAAHLVAHSEEARAKIDPLDFV